METAIRHDVSRFSDEVIYFFKQGTLYRAYEHFGAHVMNAHGQPGTYFAVWAPNAAAVSLIGDFNDWDADRHPLAPRWDSSGIWEGFVPRVMQGEIYKYHIRSQHNNYCVDKQDPYGFQCEVPPRTASVVGDLSYKWNDHGWMKLRHERNALDAPMAVYELHVGSWMRHVEGNRYLSYRELADQLPNYIRNM
ncbi:MAG TPA: 1,4-alpha-glucan branching enzyme, partial [Candidatus Omnitrophota bacterium]|nr:1,4-alpha-glucan branching enzyme [Candidatus Omnitrophota bacterium]